MIDWMGQIESIAVANPRLAVALLRNPPQLPQAYGMRKTFSSGAPGVPIEAAFDAPVTTDFWVQDISYQVQQPNFQIGSVWRGQQVYYNSLNPNIDATIQVGGVPGLPWLFSSQPLPIETIARNASGPGSDHMYGGGGFTNFVLTFPSTVKATFELTREYTNPDEEDGEIPTVVNLVFTGLTLGCKFLYGLTPDTAREVLRTEFGITTERAFGPRPVMVPAPAPARGKELSTMSEACASPTPFATERDRSILEIGSASVDNARRGIGSDPYGGYASSRVMVPEEPTIESDLSKHARYLIRLCAIVVPAFTTARLRGLRQAVTIGHVYRRIVEGENPDAFEYPVEIQQTTPDWAFQDGNISWHLRYTKGPTRDAPIAYSSAAPGKSWDYGDGVESSVLYEVGESFAGSYSGPAAGQPPGNSVGALGTFRDLRFPWDRLTNSLDLEVQGPGILAFYCSVRQTNPATRQRINDVLPEGFDTSVLQREEQFLLQVPLARYRYVAGAMIVDMGQVNRRPGPGVTVVTP